MVTLGDEVKDSITGFSGIAVARHSYLQGCDRITVQPVVGEDGLMKESSNFDEPDLEVIVHKKCKRTSTKKNPGGPEKFSDTNRPL